MRQPRGTARAVRVLIADSQRSTRIGVRAILRESGFEVCAEAADAAEAVAAALRERPDVCLLDIDLPGDGIAAAQRINAESPDTALVMLSVSNDEGEFLDALRAGAAAYLLKGGDGDLLPTIVRGVLEGQTTLPRPLVARLLERVDARDARRLAIGSLGVHLTEREREVLELLSDGLATADIAKRLFIAPVTVRSHISATLRKLGVRDRESALKLFSATPR